jgi:hypothetical protein
VDSLSAPVGSSDFQQHLLAIRQDLPVRSLALRWAGDPDVAEDALQAAYRRVAAVRHPERIKNRRAYFIKVLKHEVYHLHAPRREIPLEYPEDAQEAGIAVCGPAPERPIDETVCISLLAQSWLKRLIGERDCLFTTVPGRSDDPDRYRAVIYAAAEQVLRDAIYAEPSDADSNEALRAACPEYFDQPGASLNTLHQRFSRARADVRALLQAVVRRDELT